MNRNGKYILIMMAFFIAVPLFSSSLFRVRSNVGVKKQRLVLDINGSITYKVSKSKNRVTIEIFNCTLPAKVSKQKIESRFVKNFKLKKSGKNKVTATFTLGGEYKFNAFRMSNIIVDPSKKIKGDKIVLDVTAHRGSKTRKSLQKKSVAKAKPVKAPVKKTIAPPVTLATVIASYNKKKYTTAVKQATSVLKSRPGLAAAGYYLALSQKALALAEQKKSARQQRLHTAAATLEQVLKDSADFKEARINIVEIYRLLMEDDKAEAHNMIFISTLTEEDSSATEELSDSALTVQAKPSGIVDSSRLALRPDTQQKGESSFYFNIITPLIAVVVLLLIILLIILKRRIHRQLLEEVDDEDLEEKFPVSEVELRAEEEDVEDRIEVDAEEQPLAVAAEAFAEPAGGEPAAAYSEEEAGVVSPESSISISLGLDQNLRNRICELFDDGFTNSEIAEALEVSKDEVDFVVRSLNQKDNELKRGNDEYINEAMTGVSEADNIGDLKGEIASLKKEGLSPLDIAEKLEKDVAEVEFMLSVAAKEQDVESVVEVSPEKEDSVGGIAALAAQGLSKKEIAEKLMIGLDEVEFAASLYDISFAEGRVVKSPPPVEERETDIPTPAADVEAVEQDVAPLVTEQTKVLVGKAVTTEAADQDAEIESHEVKEYRDEKILIDEIVALAKQGYSKQRISRELAVDMDEIEFAASLNYQVVFNDEEESDPLVPPAVAEIAEKQPEEERVTAAEEILSEPTPVLVETVPVPTEQSPPVVVSEKVLQSQQEEDVLDFSDTPLLEDAAAVEEEDGFIPATSLEQGDGGDAEHKKELEAGRSAPDLELDDIISRMEVAFEGFDSADEMERESIEKEMKEKDEVTRENSKTSAYDLDSLLGGDSMEFAESRIYSYDEEIFNDAFKNSLEATNEMLGDISEEQESPAAIIADSQLQRENLEEEVEEDVDDVSAAAQSVSAIEAAEDDDMQIMRRIYSLLDQGRQVAEISQLCGLTEEEVLMYQKIKGGDV